MDIVTITLNPALDLTTRLEAMHLGEVNLVGEANLRAAGKGINVAMVLKDLGRDVGVTGWLGAENQQSFVTLFEERALADRFVRVAGSTRINVKISEQSGRVTDLNLPGLTVRDADVSALEAALDELAPQADWFVLAGSLPKGVAPDYCARLIRLLKARGKRVIFDCSGAALGEGLKAAPTLVKPNLEELGQWAGRPIRTLSDQAECARVLQAAGIPHVVVSNGADGLVWFGPDATWQAIPPRMEVVSTVGAGDSLVAGLAHGLSLGWTPEQTLRLATAVSALAVSQVAVGFDDVRELDPLLERVRVQRLDDLAPAQPHTHSMSNSGDAQ
ncbi:1-phosphofructokinase [Aeromonas sanarellii]|uniref:1-phosphofructokinase n=1 Tax=Aeromonas sanarellii TaxID=633415 RepID=UPI003986DBF5